MAVEFLLIFDVQSDIIYFFYFSHLVASATLETLKSVFEFISEISSERYLESLIKNGLPTSLSLQCYLGSTDLLLYTALLQCSFATRAKKDT